MKKALWRCLPYILLLAYSSILFSLLIDIEWRNEVCVVEPRWWVRAVEIPLMVGSVSLAFGWLAHEIRRSW